MAVAVAPQSGVQTFRMTPYDIQMHWSKDGLAALHGSMNAWLQHLDQPSRFITYLKPITLNNKISEISSLAQRIAKSDPGRVELLMEHLRYLELLQGNRYQQTAAFFMIWGSHESGIALSSSMAQSFHTSVAEAPLPPLFDGAYEVRERPLWHLAPVGRAGGRLLWATLTSYEFYPQTWGFGLPLQALMYLPYPIAIAIDIPHSLKSTEARAAVEQKVAEYDSHLKSTTQKDSRAEQRITDCLVTLAQLNNGDTLHKIQITIAVAAPDTATLQKRLAEVSNAVKPNFSLRQEWGELLSRSIGYFSPKSSREIRMPETTWPVVSSELAFMFSPLGYRKLATTDGVLRGEAREGYPVFHHSWVDKSATHEIVVGRTGSGKTFWLNTYLTRSYAVHGVPFDLIEPLGHGQYLAEAVGIPLYKLSSRDTTLNPLDIMFPNSLIEQKSHVLRLFEMVLGRSLSGEQTANNERYLLSLALDQVYGGFPDLNAITPALTPTVEELCQFLGSFGKGSGNLSQTFRRLAANLAAELAGLCCGSGPWASFLNGKTTINLAQSNSNFIGPRVFSFKDFADDNVMLAITYIQVISAIWRDSISNEQPRIIAIDEVYRMMQYPALLPFLIKAAKTLRTRRKKLIFIDQEMGVFLEGEARHIFENAPIRVIFRQNSTDIFHSSAFQHFTEGHCALIGQLPKGYYIFDVSGEGVWCVYNRASESELRRFGST